MAALPGRRTLVSPPASEAGDGERHREAVIVEAVGDGAVERRAAMDRQVVAVDLDAGAERRGGPATVPAIRSDSLCRSSPAPRIIVVPRTPASRPGRGSGSRRSRRPPRPDRGRSPGARSNGPRGRPSARRRRSPASTPRPCRPLLDVGAHRPEDVDDGPSRRIDADAAERQLGVRMDRRRRRARTRPPRHRPGPARSPLPREPPPSRLTATPRPAPSSSVGPATPRARSIRSVWSRVATASRTVVRPPPGARRAGSPT